MKKDNCIFCKETASKVFCVAQKVGDLMKEKLQPDGLNLVQNNGEVAGQTVMHFHLHMIPRYKDDGQHILWKPTSPSDEELDEIRDRIVG